MTLDDVRSRMVSISPLGKGGQQAALGIIAERFIITCAHHLPAIGIGIFTEAAFEVRRIHETRKRSLFQYSASSHDLMVISDQMPEEAVEGGIDDADRADWELWTPEDEEGRPRLMPVAVAAGTTDPVRTPGYFFAPDGRTPVAVEFKPSRTWPFLHMDIPAGFALKGCSGGPLMTADHKLIGIVIGAYRGHETQARAVQIDLVLPEFVKSRMGWDTL